MVQAFEDLVRILGGKLLHLECSKVVHFNLNLKASWKGNGYGCEPQSPKAQEAEASTSEGRRIWTSQLKKEENLYFLCLFVLFGLPKDWAMLTHISEDRSLLSLLSQMLISSRNTLSHSEMMFCQLSGHPLAQSS